MKQRIISVVPSLTELLADLELEEEVIGITKFCIYPEAWFRSKQRIGGTKTLDLERIYALKPDLIIANKEENTQTQIEMLQNYCPVLLTDIQTWQQALEAIELIGRATNRAAQAQKLIESLNKKYEDYFCKIGQRTPSSAAYLIWREPYMAAAAETFIHEMLHIAGFDNVFKDKNRYPEIQLADLQTRQPEYILLSSEPYPFKQIHVTEIQKACPKSQVKLVDGELFSWYGSRLLHSFDYFLKEFV